MDNFDLKKYLGSKTLLKESAPGYDTRKFGEALPTLESVQAAYEDKEEPRDGVKSAAEKLGMKPSHVKEEENNDQTSPYPFESVNDVMRYLADNNVSIIEPYLIKSINGTLEDEEENSPVPLTPERIGEIVEQIIKAESNR